MTAEIVVRASGALMPVSPPLESAAQALDNTGLTADVEAFRLTQQASRRAWEDTLAKAIPARSADDLFAGERWDWVSPMAGRQLPAVEMDWAGLDWSRGRDGGA